MTIGSPPAVQVGKKRTKLHVPADLDAAGLEAAALAAEPVRALIGGQGVRRVIAVPGSLVNIIVG